MIAEGAQKLGWIASSGYSPPQLLASTAVMSARSDGDGSIARPAAVPALASRQTVSPRGLRRIRSTGSFLGTFAHAS